ncbi:MAG TPA: hypothetical protein VN930_02400 [Xanthobacteraceae bacterium]|nr:hypothetical protein [Xanthobacteraceae bacterium]
MRLSRRRMLLAPLALGGPLLFPRALSAKPLWPGARYSEEWRTRAMQRGLRFIYATAVKPKHFAEYGDDYLWCFYTISNTAADPALKRTARTMGEERARAWRRLHPRVPAGADANDISSLVFGSQAADQLGLRDGRMEDALRRAAARFRAADYLSFDPIRELPPADVPDTCARCDSDNPRGTRRCRTCGNKLDMTDPYEVLCDALIATYTGDRYGVRLGAGYPEVTALLPKMRPYRGYDGGRNPRFVATAYAITHIIYTMNDYGTWRLKPQWLPAEHAFLIENLAASIKINDPETTGEFLDTLKAFGAGEDDPLIRAGVEFVLSRQNKDGSWGDVTDKDIYQRYHPTWTAVDGLRDYAFQGERASFPDALKQAQG